MKRFYNLSDIGEYKAAADTAINLVRLNRYNLEHAKDEIKEKELIRKVNNSGQYIFASDRLNDTAQLSFMIKMMNRIDGTIFLCRDLNGNEDIPEHLSERIFDASCLDPYKAYDLCDSYIFFYDEALKDSLHSLRKYVLPSTPIVEMDATVMEAFNYLYNHLEIEARPLYLIDENDVISSGADLLAHLLGGTVPEGAMEKFIRSEDRGNNCYIAFQKLARDYPEFRNRMLEFSYRNIHVYQQMRTEDSIYYPPFRREELMRLFSV